MSADLTPDANPVVELDKVSLAFGGLKALTELDLVVNPREIVSVIGPNGAGKTTVFNVITGVYEPTEGDVRFLGELADLAFLAPGPRKTQDRLPRHRLGVAVGRGHHVLDHRHVEEQPQALEGPGDPDAGDPVRRQPGD